jgi:hypothetical protein
VPTPGATEEIPEDTGESQRPSTQEFWLLKLLFLHEDLADWCSAHLESDWIQHVLARQIVSRRMEAHRKNNWRGLGAFLDECEAPGMQNLITEAAAEDRPIPNPAQQLADVAVRLRNHFVDRQLHTLIQRANQPDADETARVELLRQQQLLRQLKRQPISPPG